MQNYRSDSTIYQQYLNYIQKLNAYKYAIHKIIFFNKQLNAGILYKNIFRTPQRSRQSPNRLQQLKQSQETSAPSQNGGCINGKVRNNKELRFYSDDTFV